MEQVLAEASLAHRLRQVDVRRRDEAHVDLERARAAETLEAPLVDDAQQLRLQRRREVQDLVEVERAPGGHLDLADLGRARVREGATLVPEQLRLEQLRRDRRAVDLQERPFAADAAVVQPVRDEVLARAALALEQHGAARVGEAQHERHELPHGGRLGHDTGERPAGDTRHARDLHPLRPAPEALEVVEGARARREDVDDEAVVVEQDPLPARIALDVRGPAALGPQRLEHGVRDRDQLPLVEAREQHEEVGEVRGRAQVEDDRVLGLLRERRACRLLDRARELQR